jgi:hypothetical protein
MVTTFGPLCHVAGVPLISGALFTSISITVVDFAAVAVTVFVAFVVDAV